jgi:hypothetical protein
VPADGDGKRHSYWSTSGWRFSRQAEVLPCSLLCHGAQIAPGWSGQGAIVSLCGSLRDQLSTAATQRILLAIVGTVVLALLLFPSFTALFFGHQGGEEVHLLAQLVGVVIVGAIAWFLLSDRN